VIDSICPYGYEFEAEKNDVENLEDLIQKIVDLISIF